MTTSFTGYTRAWRVYGYHPVQGWVSRYAVTAQIMHIHMQALRQEGFLQVGVQALTGKE